MRIQRNTWHTEDDARQAATALVCAECGSALKYGQHDGEWVTACVRRRFHRGVRPKPPFPLPPASAHGPEEVPPV